MVYNPLVSAKIQAPLLRPNRVKRGHLVEKISRAYQGGSRLTLICAPAGYGKTTLAVEWLETQTAAAWVSLDERDNDPARFLTCVVSALQSLEPGAGSRTVSMLNVPQAPPVEHLMAELIDEISQSQRPFVLALDDYHHIHQAAIHDALEFLLNYQPANLHILITTREDPPFPLSRLRARGQLTEIRSRDLRFGVEETQDFLTQVHQLKLPQDTIEKLTTLTEGWAAGLQLAGLAIQNEDDARHFFETFSGTHHYIIEYLVDEVLAHQPAEVQDFLKATSILDRFNAELCSAVTGEPVDYRAVLLNLERSNLFMTAVDTTREWFRYHRLFADVLRASLDPKEEVKLHERAAQWFETHQLPAEAIGHYLAAGNSRAAGRLIHSQAGELVEHGELQTLLLWTRSLPPAEFLADPGLLAYQPLTLLLTGDIRGSQTLLDQGQNDPEMQQKGEMLAVRAWLRMVSGDHYNMRETAEQALARLAPDEAIFRTLAQLVLGDYYFSNQQVAASTRAYQDAYLLGLQHHHTFAAMAGLSNMVFNLYDLGEMNRAIALCQEAYNRFTDSRGNPLPVLGMIDVPMSMFYLEQRNLEKAVEFARRGREQCQKLFSSGMMGGDAEHVLALATHLQGRREEGYQILAEMRQFAARHGVTALEDKMIISEAELHLREGDTAAAIACMDLLNVREHAFTPAVAITLQFGKAEIHLNQGLPEAALELLAPMEDTFRREGITRRLIRLLGLKAAAFQLLSRETEALQSLEEAARLAALEGFMNIFLRGAARIAELFPKIRSAAPGFVEKAIELTHSDSSTRSSISSQTSIAQEATPVEPISEQERKILRLLAAGLSNQEIAQELVISTGTVKWHVHNILEKLGVSSRSQAAAKARDLGIGID